MKKIFVLLFSIWIPIYVVIGLFASCENSVAEDNIAVKETPRTQIADDENVNANERVDASFSYTGGVYMYQ